MWQCVMQAMISCVGAPTYACVSLPGHGGTGGFEQYIFFYSFFCVFYFGWFIFFYFTKNYCYHAYCHCGGDVSKTSGQGFEVVAIYQHGSPLPPSLPEKGMWPSTILESGMVLLCFSGLLDCLFGLESGMDVGKTPHHYFLVRFHLNTYQCRRVWYGFWWP